MHAVRKMCKPAALLLASSGLALAVAAACGGRTEGPPTETTAQRTEVTIAGETGSPPGLVVRWDAEPVDVQDVPFDLPLSIENLTDGSLSVEVTLVAYGMDQRRVERVIDTVNVAAEDEEIVDVSVEDFPLRSTAAPASVFASARVTVNNQEILVASERITYAFNGNMSEITFYGWRNKARDLFHENDSFAEFLAIRNMDSEAYLSSGDVWDEGEQEFVPVENLPPNESADGVIVYSGSADGTEKWPETLTDPGDVSAFTPPDPEDENQVRVCVNWAAQFIDAGFNDDYMNGTGVIEALARYTAVRLREASSTNELFVGYLDTAGCTPYIQLGETGNYVATLHSILKRDSATVTVKGPDGSIPAVWQPAYSSVYFSKTEANEDPSTAIVTAPYPLKYGNTGMVLSRALIMNENGFPSGTSSIDIFTDDNCGGLGGCASSNFSSKTGYIKLGVSKEKVNGEWIYNTEYKNVIAHELGHVVHGFGSGMFYLHDYSPGEGGAPPADCECNHVTSSNSLHCLQSREMISPAHVEGFAHVYATKVMNDYFGSGCTFVYYKEFLDGSTVVPPPIATDCTAQVKWLETECLVSNRGVEYDWNNFLWAIHSAPTSDRTTMTDLYDIYLEACGTDCSGFDMEWADFDAAAETHHGSMSDEYAQIDQSGDDYGVNH